MEKQAVGSSSTWPYRRLEVEPHFAVLGIRCRRGGSKESLSAQGLLPPPIFTVPPPESIPCNVTQEPTITFTKHMANLSTLGTITTLSWHQFIAHDSLLTLWREI